METGSGIIVLRTFRLNLRVLQVNTGLSLSMHKGQASSGFVNQSLS